MKSWRLIALLTAVVFTFACGFTSVQGPKQKGDIPNVTEEMLYPGFWANKLDDADKVIMTQKEIENYNGNIRKSVNAVADLESYPNVLTHQELREKIKEYKLPRMPQYNIAGHKLKESYFNSLLENRNLKDIKKVNPVRFGLTVNRTNMRSFPTDELLMSEPGDIEFDSLQETSLHLGTPMAVLHTSLDGKWYFCQAASYLGWVAAGDVAIRDKKYVLHFAGVKPFAVVTGNHVKTGHSPHNEAVSNVSLEMGVRLPLVVNPPADLDGQAGQGNLTVLMPLRDAKGRLEIKKAMIPSHEDVTVGYMPYTRANIIRQAFKMQGDRYDWGGRSGGHDCSSFLQDIFLSFGFELPRNTGEQEEMYAIKYDLKNKSDAEKTTVLTDLKPGALLYMPGHTMLYLGRVEGRNYIIHDFATYGKKTGQGGYVSAPAMEVAVTGVDLPRSDGQTFLGHLTSALVVQD